MSDEVDCSSQKLCVEIKLLVFVVLQDILLIIAEIILWGLNIFLRSGGYLSFLGFEHVLGNVGISQNTCNLLINSEHTGSPHNMWDPSPFCLFFSSQCLDYFFLKWPLHKRSSSYSMTEQKWIILSPWQHQFTFCRYSSCQLGHWLNEGSWRRFVLQCLAKNNLACHSFPQTHRERRIKLTGKRTVNSFSVFKLIWRKQSV